MSRELTIELPRIDVPPQVLTALGRLNQHARAYGCGRKAIYSYKTLAAGVLATNGQLQSVKLIEWKGRCRDCDGTGRYHYLDSGDRADHCWKCNNSGTASLKFVLTVLPDEQVWHHPFDHAGTPGRNIAEIADVLRWDGDKGRYIYKVDGIEYPEAVWWPAGKWMPGRCESADRLSVDALASLLNEVEAWVLSPDVSWGVACRWLIECARRTMREYVVDLGRVSDRCWYCGDPEIATGLSRPGPPFAWSAPACREHKNIGVDRWPGNGELPEDVLTTALQAWKARHERIGFAHDTMFGW